MFRTQNTDMAGLPGMFGEGLTHWHSVSRVLAMHWYHVTVEMHVAGRVINIVEMVNDEVRLDQLVTAQSTDFIISDLQVVTPAWMNKSGSWKMEKLTSVSVGCDQTDVVVCLLETQGGNVYYDSHDPSCDVGSLTNIRKLY